MNRPLPLDVRKELLLARASVERAELARALDRFAQAREPFERIARMASGLGGAAAPSGLLGLLGYARSHPYLGAVVSLLANGLRRTAAGRWAFRGLAAGAVTAGLVWMLSRGRKPGKG
jgi:hypothetical protein